MLIFDGKTALAGAAEGVTLCLNTLIPSLFPFFLMSILLTSTLAGQAVVPLRPIAAACGIPKKAEFLLAIGLLGGYPVGAKNVALLYSSGQLTPSQAARMIVFCNNAGPAFIFGILGSMFSDPRIPWLLWAVHIASALLVGMLLPGNAPTGAVEACRQKVRVTDALEQAVKVMALVCGWVVLMRMVLAFLDRWLLWILPLPVQVATAGILELSNGCIRLSQLGIEGLRFIIAAGLLSLGGVCVTLQTASVADRIPMRLYFPGKILQCSISVLMSCVLQIVFPASMRCHCGAVALTAGIIGFGCLLSLRYSEKSSRIPEPIGV